MLKDAGRGDMVAKFLGGGLAKRPLESAPRLQRLVAKSVAGNPRGAPSNRMVAGLAQELSNRKVPAAHPWNQRVMLQRGTMNTDKAADFKAADVVETAKLNFMLSKCAGALMGATRMIPVGKALSALKRASAIAGAGAGVTKLAPPRPIAFQHPTLPGGKPAPIMPERPAGLLNARPLVRPPNFNSTFDTSGGLPIGTHGTFGKVSALRNLSPLARIIGNMPASHFRF